jgi:DNA-binding CsgD family transcriptional regulator/tetratricopeptide (TPR) repeat protein
MHAGQQEQAAPTLARSTAPFLGRDREFNQLRRSLDWPDQPRGRVVQVSGDPGIGKTRLLGEFTALARAAGWPVLWGQATELERDVPFGVLINALDDHVSELPPARLAGLGAEHLTLLRVAGPFRLGSAGASGTELMDVERFRLHRAIRALLEVLAEPDGLLLVLDDAHWADDGSGELLDHLLRNPARARLLLALAHRPRQISARLATALARAQAAGTAEVLTLGPLSLPDVETLLGPGVGQARGRELYHASGGNPLYLEALLREGLRESGASEPSGQEKTPGNGNAATAAQAVLSAELTALSPLELRVAGAAAVAADTFDVALVVTIAECDTQVALSALDRLSERDLIRPAAVPGTWRYRHPVLRSVVYAATAAGWRLAAHARAALALQARGAPASARAHHVERSASPEDQAAIDILLEAASATMNTTPASAAHWLEVALRLLPAADSTLKRRLELLGLRAKALGVTGRLAESRDVLHEVLALLPAQPAEQRAQVVGFCALMDRLLGRHAEARALLLGELNRLGESDLGDRDTAATAMLKLELAAGRLIHGDFSTDQDCAQEAMVIARRLGDRCLLAAALGMCALNDLSDASIVERSFCWLDESADLVDAVADSELARHITAAVHLGWAEMHFERIDDALRHLERGLRLARASGQNHLLTHLLLGYGTTLGLVGRLREAGDCFDDALEAAALTGSDALRVMALTQRCWITLWQGDIRAALCLGEEAVARASGVDDWFSALASGTLAQARFYAGDPAGCVELLLQAGQGPQLRSLNPAYGLGWLELLVEATAAYDPELAATWAEQVADLTSTTEALPRRRGFGHLAQAWALRSVDPATCATQALAAATLFDQAGDGVDAGRAYLLAATTLEASGRGEHARRALARARTLFDTCGAGLFQARALREERRQGARAPRQSRRSGQLGGLTRREIEVASLVTAGLTNRQIAQRLYLSPRTVEVHLSRILAKLDVTTRSAIAPAMIKAPPRPGTRALPTPAAPPSLSPDATQRSVSSTDGQARPEVREHSISRRGDCASG